jgi:hypothetical protein
MLNEVHPDLNSLPDSYWKALAKEIEAAEDDQKRVEITADAFAKLYGDAR